MRVDFILGVAEYEVDYRPTITMTMPSSSSVSTTATSPSWVEVSVTTHAPSSRK